MKGPVLTTSVNKQCLMKVFNATQIVRSLHSLGKSNSDYVTVIFK